MDFITLKFLLTICPNFYTITQIFKNNYINDGIVVHCHNASDMITLQKAFNTDGIKVLFCKFDEFGKYHIYSKVGIVLDTSCEGWINVFQRYSSSDYRTQINWIINTIDLFSSRQVLSEIILTIDSNVILISNNSNNRSNLHEAYNTGFKNNGHFVMRDIGFRNTTFNLLKQSRNDLHGALLKCVSVITDLLVNETYMHFLEESRHEKSDTLHKLKFYTVIRYLQEMYNFSVRVHRTNSWGYSRNGSFDGLVGSLQRREADFGCSPVLFKTNRAEVVNYVIPTWQTKHAFLFRHPKYHNGYFSIYTRPLDGLVWCCMLAALLIAGLTLNLVIIITSVNATYDEKDFSLSYIWLFICGAVCQQGMPIDRKTSSARIIIFVTFIFTMIIHQFYNANILSSLLNEQYNYIRSLQDLLHSDMRAGVEDMLFNRDYFKRTTERISLELYNKKIVTGEHNNFFDAEHGMNLVRRGGFAFHVDTSAAYRLMRRTFSEREICEVGEVQLFPPQYVGAVTVRGSQYGEYIARGVSKMLEAGLMNRIKTSWDNRKPTCPKLRYSNVMTAVNIGEFAMAIFVLVWGLLLAILVLLFEMCTRKNKKPKLRSQNHFKIQLKRKNCKHVKVRKAKRCISKYLYGKRITFIN